MVLLFYFLVLNIGYFEEWKGVALNTNLLPCKALNKIVDKEEAVLQLETKRLPNLGFYASKETGSYGCCLLFCHFKRMTPSSRKTALGCNTGKNF